MVAALGGLRGVCRSGSVALLLGQAFHQAPAAHQPQMLCAAAARRSRGSVPALSATARRQHHRLFSTSGGASAGPPKVRELWVLKYDYVHDILQKREPHRAEHIGLLKKAADKGLLALGGALGDPVDTALLVFTQRGAATSFTEVDPYIKNGLVTNWSVRPWAVVVGSVADQFD